VCHKTKVCQSTPGHIHMIVRNQETTVRLNNENNNIAITLVLFSDRKNMKAPQTFNASMPVSLRCLCWSLMMMNGVPNSSKPNDPGMKDMIPFSTFSFVTPLYTRATKIKSTYLKHENSRNIKTINEKEQTVSCPESWLKDIFNHARNTPDIFF